MTWGYIFDGDLAYKIRHQFATKTTWLDLGDAHVNRVDLTAATLRSIHYRN